MRPRSLDRGEDRWPDTSNCRRCGFNEAAVVGPRRGERVADLVGAPAGFNEAAVVGPRRAATVTSPRAGISASMRPRSLDRGELPAGVAADQHHVLQ